MLNFYLVALYLVFFQLIRFLCQAVRDINIIAVHEILQGKYNSWNVGIDLSL